MHPRSILFLLMLIYVAIYAVAFVDRNAAHMRAARLETNQTTGRDFRNCSILLAAMAKLIAALLKPIAHACLTMTTKLL